MTLKRFMESSPFYSSNQEISEFALQNLELLHISSSR